MRPRGLIVVTMIAGCALLVSAVAFASPKTSARIYQAFKSGGTPAITVTKTINGSCFSGSSEADRNDAWRCMSKNFLYDPCFSSSKATGIVLCPPHAWQQSGVEIKLTKALPTKFGNKPKPSTSGRPWAMQTTTGLKCVMEGMGPFISSKQFGDYACTNGKWLWDQPNRKTQPWTIHIAGVKATKLTTKTKVGIAWF